MTVSCRHLPPLLLAALLGLCGCGSEAGGPTATESARPATTQPLSPTELILFCGLPKPLVQPLVERFEAESGVRLNVKYGASRDLVQEILDQHQAGHQLANLVWVSDSSLLDPLEQANLLATIPEATLQQILDRQLSYSDRRLTTTAHTRGLGYSRKLLRADELPRTLQDLTQPQWRGRIGWAPTDPALQRYLAGVHKALGDQAMRSWLQGMLDNQTRSLPDQETVLQQVGRDQLELGLIDQPDLARRRLGNDRYPVAAARFAPRDVGNQPFRTALGVVAEQPSTAALAWLDFVLQPLAQQYLTDQSFHYPVVASVIGNPHLPPYGPWEADLPDSDFERDLPLAETQALLRELGLLPAEPGDAESQSGDAESQPSEAAREQNNHRPMDSPAAGPQVPPPSAHQRDGTPQDYRATYETDSRLTPPQCEPRTESPTWRRARPAA